MNSSLLFLFSKQYNVRITRVPTGTHIQLKPGYYAEPVSTQLIIKKDVALVTGTLWLLVTLINRERVTSAIITHRAKNVTSCVSDSVTG